MESLRADLLRRARLERDGDGEQGAGSQEVVNGRSAMQETNFERPNRLLFGPRPLVPRILRRQRDAQPEEVMTSPKTPDGNERAPTFVRPWAPNVSSYQPQTAPSRTSPYESQQNLLPVAAPVSRGSTQPTPSCQIRTFDTPDPAEVHLARLAEEGRMMRASTRSQTTGQRRPRRFLFCFPHVKSRRVRTQILHCFVSGSFLILLLTICKPLIIDPTLSSRVAPR